MSTITLIGLTIERGFADVSDGGGVYVLNGTVVVDGCRIIANSAPGDVDRKAWGAGLYIDNGSVTVTNSAFQNNVMFPFGEGGVFTSEQEQSS